MENNLLTGENPTTGMATTNPQTNISQLSNQSNATISQPNTSNTTNANQVNPITIPIQIQPQIAQTTQASTTQPSSNLQANQQSVSYNAPTPQTYQESSTSNNIVDFNQIFKSYNQALGNTTTNTTANSGIKKTSYNTTIVTPTASNLNTVEGQYQSAYSDTINGLISEMLTQMKNGFQYDPTSDNALKMATEYSANSTLQSLAGSGVLNSSATSERVARIVSELIPQYEEKAHSRWIEYIGQLADTAQLIMNYDSQQFEYWKDAKDREFEEKQFEYQKQQDALENAWKRVDELGYVDNEASTILGVAVGTLSGEARLTKEQQEFELAKMREQAEIEYANNEALYKLKSELDLEQSKALATYESELSKSETAYKYQLEQQYNPNSSSSSTSTVSLSTYDDIIKNRWATYDDYTKQYTVSDKTSVYNYLKNEYASGRISLNDVYSLMSKYDINSTSSSTTITNNSKPNTLLGALNSINQQIINGSKSSK